MKKIAIVTGASSGMGRELVLQLPQWEQLDEIWVIARRTERLQELCALSPVPLRPVSMDLAAPTSWEHYRELLAAAQPRVVLLANVAGFGKFGRSDCIPLSEAMDMIDLNCKALVAMSQLTLPYMQEGSKILNLDSLSAFQPVPYLNVYASTKSFVLSYSRALNRELRTQGIRVMSVNPGWVRTEFFQRAEAGAREDAVSYFSHIYEAKDVMHTALKHLYTTKKDVSIHGFSVRWQVRLVKLLPHRLVMNIWMRQQKHK